MIVKLLAEHHLEFLSLKGGCRGSSRVYACQNVKLLEISCRGINKRFISNTLLSRVLPTVLHAFLFLLGTCIYFILSSEINAYQKQIKVISITSEMI